MKNLFLTLIISTFLCGGAMADFIDHPQYAKVTTFAESIVQSVSDAQNDFFITNGRYFQGLWLLGPQVAVDGTTDEAVNNTSTPDDLGFSWRDFAPTIFKNNLTIPINIKIDVYESPQGWGWIIVGEVFYDGLGPDAYGTEGSHWVYQHHEGPEERPGRWDEWHIDENNPYPEPPDDE